MTLIEAKSKLVEKTAELESAIKEYWADPSATNARTLKDATSNHYWAVAAVKECKRRYAMEKSQSATPESCEVPISLSPLGQAFVKAIKEAGE